MSWIKLQFIVDSEQVEPLSSILEAFLALSITTENAGEDEFYEIAFPGTPDWEKILVSALYDEEVDVKPIIEFIQKTLSIETPIECLKLADQNWTRVWLDSFKPIKIGDQLWVCPSWCEPVDSNARNIILDPGLAFGTGTHPTTHLCLQWLSEQNLSEKRVLDYGAGSGILAIGALLCGASHADAVDIDPLAVSACNDNAERNNVSQQINSYLPEQYKTKKNDIVIANILAQVIIELRELLLSNLADDGVLLLTGILSTQADLVTQTFAEHIDFEIRQQEQWCLLIGKRH